MARKTTQPEESPAAREDRLTAIRYAHNIEDPRFLICRRNGRHVPHELGNGTFKDVRPDPATGGKIIETYCERCGQEMVRKLWPNYRPNGGWKVKYVTGEGGYRAKPGEGYGLVSKDARAEFWRMTFEGVPDIDQTQPRGKRQRKSS